jgi:hypothetical protein
MADTRDTKKARKALRQAIEAIDGVDWASAGIAGPNCSRTSRSTTALRDGGDVAPAAVAAHTHAAVRDLHAFDGMPGHRYSLS